MKEDLIDSVKKELERHIRRMFALRGQSDLTQWMLEPFTDSAMWFLHRHENVTVQDFADAAQTVGEEEPPRIDGRLERPSFGGLARKALEISIKRNGGSEYVFVVAQVEHSQNPPRNIPIDPEADAMLDAIRIPKSYSLAEVAQEFATSLDAERAGTKGSCD